MNILKLQDQLKGLPDDALVMHVQNPTGQVPTYLALGELQRRKEMRSKYQADAQTPTQSVAQELVAENTQPPPPPPGLAGLPQAQPMMEAMAPPQEMPVQQMAQGGLADLDVGDMFNEQSYAGGGIVAFAEGGDTESSMNLDSMPSLNLNTVGSGLATPLDAFLGGRPGSFMQYMLSQATGKPVNQALNLNTGKQEPQFAQGGEVQHFEEGGATSRFGDFMRSLGNVGGIQLDKQIGALQAEKEKIRGDIFRAYTPEQKAAHAQRISEIDAQIADLSTQRRGKSGAVSNAPSTPPGPNVMGSQAAADKMFGTQYDPSQSIGYKGAPVKDGASKAIGSAYNEERIRSIGDYGKELQDFLGPDKNLDLQRERLAKMEGRASRMEQQAPWLALLEAGLGTMAGTSPFALTNLGAGAQMGVRSYGAAQDKLAMLEEKRMVIGMNMEQAERREKLAVAEFGAKSKEAAQERNFKRQLQREHDATLKQMNTDDNIKALMAAEIKSQPSVAESLKVKEYVEGKLPQEEKLILKDLGGNSSDPESKNFSAYLDRMERAKLKLEKEAIRRPGVPSVTTGNVTTSRAKFLGFE
jgi:hypothetical protein